ncbi:hypothetical protein CcrC1_gp005 [Caulobacter phage C1]|nr:hypothetical protein CcrC1_gp498 [Caulobacter phage C1]UTU08233.1 hypothetical protein CcrC2_gp483 [Caulobacter phage C2]UTU08756.1 hypothetical protein CcrJ4_gp496 [Caulobacter phage J4]UTU09292.1 hypothetical protein CcrBL47_gp522 [Caulobacter phage BL47]UTU09868.1 hypothetical protein CcrRB23_gp501 [Caulobacter phage RB23]WGN96892.1 hypothetical protein [Bertelyvirus sp.]
MWEVKTFKTRLAKEAWIARNEARYQIVEIVVANAYGVEFKPLRRIG